MKKHFGKKGLSLLLSLLMAITAIPFAVMPAAAESATIKKSAWAVVSSGSGNQRYNSDSINVCNDGAVGNMSAGFMWFDISGISGSVENATLSVKMRKNSSNMNLESKIQVYSIDPSNTNLPSKANGADVSKFTTLFGTGYQANSEANPNNVKNTLGVLNETPLAEFKVCDLSTTATAKSVNLKSAIEKALLNGRTELCLMFIDHKSQNNGSPDWSDCWVNYADAAISCTYDPSTGGTLNASLSKSGVVYNGSGTRYDSSKLTVASDGEASNTTAGFLYFDISAVVGKVKSATLKVDLKRNSEAVNAAIYAVDPSKISVSGQQNDKFSAVFQNSFSGQSTVSFENAKNYFGITSSDPSVSIASSSLEQSQKTSSFDVSKLVEFAKNKGYTTLCLMFVIPTSGQQGASGGWTDIDVFYKTANLTCQYDETDFGEGKAADVAKENVKNVNSVKNLNTDVTTIHGSFPGDSTYLTDANYDATYHNVLYWGGIASSGTNHSATTGTIQLGSSGTGSNSVAIYYYQPTVTLLYDGDTSNLPRFGVMVNSDPTKTGSWGARCDHQNFYIDGDGKGFGFTENWHARVGAGGNLDFQWVWNSSDANARACYTYGKTDPWIQAGSTTGIANIMRFTGTMGTGEYVRTFTPTYGAQFGNGSNYYTRTATSSNNVTIINYAPLKKAIEEAKTELAKIKANPKKYTNTSVLRYVNYAKGLVSAKPNNFVNATSNQYMEYSTIAQTAISNWNNRGSLEIQKYNVIFRNTDGTDVKTVALDYDSAVDCAALAPSNSVKQISGNDSQHQTYKWDDSAYVSKVVDEVVIGEVENTRENHTFGDWKDAGESSHKKTCSVCGYELTASHNAGTPVTTVEPGCTTTGSKVTSCTDCKRVMKTETINATGHVNSELDASTVVAATCTEKGYSGDYKCTVCGAVTQYGHEISALGHDFGDWTATKNANCTEGGTEERHCRREGCSVTETRATSALGHTQKILPAVAATCTETGLTEGIVCSVCGAVITAQTTVPAKGHSFTNYVSNNNATCTDNATETAECDNGCGEKKTREIADSALGHEYVDDGEKIYTDCTSEGIQPQKCKRCGDKIELAIPPKGHTEVSAGNAKAPTCTDAGKESDIVCKDCNAMIKEGAKIDALGHSFKDYVSDKNATCTADGTKTAKCERCDEKDTIADTGSKLPHTESEWIVDKNATCTEKGSRYKKCTVCETELSREKIEPLGHDYSGDVTAPTCTAEGYTTFTCSRCESTYVGETVPALGHTEVIDKAVSATCTSTGLTEGKHCSVCGEVLLAQTVIPAIGHKNKVHHEKVEPTCTEEGKIEYWSCPDCSKNFSDENCVIEANDLSIAPTGHTEVLDKAVLATCTETGLTEGKHCSVCGKVLLAQEVVPATNHKNKVHFSKIEPTCTEKGTKEYWLCPDCSKKFTDESCTAEASDLEIDAKGHTASPAVIENKTESTCTSEGSYDEVVYCAVCKTELSRERKITDKAAHSYEENVVLPTCTEEGYTVHTCSVCGDSYTDSKVAPLGHSFTNYVSDNNATCTADGTKTAKCDRCAETKTIADEGSKLAHTPSAWITDKNSSCTEGGTKHTECTVCHTVIETAEIPADGHNYVAVVTAPTCTTEGFTTYTCSVCGESYTDSKVAPLGHSFTNYVSDNNATCTADGTKTAKCDRCDETKTIADEGSKLAHTPSAWITDKNSSCTEGGTKHTECTVCHTVLETAEIPAGGHSYVAVVTAPTCTTEGFTTYTCSVCGSSYVSDRTEKVGHTEVIDKAVSATCTESGLTEGKHCSVCGEVLVAQNVLPATGHKNRVHHEKVEPTCTAEGSIEYWSCVDCSKNFSDENCKNAVESVVLEKKAHTVVKDAAVPATCTEPGLTEGKHCSVCGEVLLAQETVPATGHKDSDKNGVCDVCGAEVEVVCNCICHKTFFLMKFIYAIQRFFWKMFGIAKTCDCGALHY
ncbi:MAG: hypothetical protein Q4D20_03305 [Clostridia bacterium]|nr:hypothetical protein [Clostridia bacterium]